MEPNKLVRAGISPHEPGAEGVQPSIYGKGIQATAGFDLSAKLPLDTRFVVETAAERDLHVTGNRAYQGMLVYVKDENKTYQLKQGNTWEEFGTVSDITDHLVNDLTTGGANKALTAEQGRVLKGQVDAVSGRVEELSTKHDEEVAAINETLGQKADTSTVNEQLAQKAALAGSREQDFSAKNLTVAGNLFVEGTTTSVNTDDMAVKDNIVVLNQGEAGEGVTKGKSGIEIDRGTSHNFFLVFDEADDKLKAGISEDGEAGLKPLATVEYVDNKVNPINQKLNQKAEQTALQSEIDRAKGQEAAIRSEFAEADTAIKQTVTAANEAIEAEVARATGEEGKLRTSINGKIDKTAIANALNVTTENQVLDARQGKVLNDKITQVDNKHNSLNTVVQGHTTQLGTVDSRIATAKEEAIAAAAEATTTALEGKADKAHTHTIANVTGLTEKLAGVDTSIGDLQAADAAINERLAGIDTSVGNITQIQKDITQIKASVQTETRERTEADTALGGRIDGLTTTVEGKASKQEVTESLKTKVDKSAILDGAGKLLPSVIPSMAITEVFVVATQEEMLKLVAQPGDIAIRTDLSQTFILKSGVASSLESWVELSTPTCAVTSVNGMTGAVVLNKSHVGLGNVVNESKATMFTNPTFTGTVQAPTVGAGDNSTKVATTAYVKSQNYLTASSVIDGGTF